MNSPEFYKNKVVLITGGSMGIGKEMALQVLQHGGKVIITGRNQERLTVVQKEYQDYIERLTASITLAIFLTKRFETSGKQEPIHQFIQLDKETPPSLI